MAKQNAKRIDSENLNVKSSKGLLNKGLIVQITIPVLKLLGQLAFWVLV